MGFAVVRWEINIAIDQGAALIEIQRLNTMASLLELTE
jgi:hypothetical protein